MTIEITQISTIDPQKWNITFTSTAGAPITVWVDGDLRDTISQTSATGIYTTTIYADADAIIDIIEGTDLDADTYPRTATLGWYHAEEAERYRVEKYDTDQSEWVRQATIPDTFNSYGYYTWYYKWESDVLEDETDHQYRVISEGPHGTEGSPTTLDVLMVRHPDPPNAEYDYDEATRTLTITEAA